MAQCQPSCAGAVCGDDGCGGSCGGCGSDEKCESGACVESCSPNFRKEVGDEYQGGIVILVNAGGGGMIAAASSIKAASWSFLVGPDYTTGITDKSVGAGQSNTDKIIAIMGTNHQYAARRCNDIKMGGYEDWFLPSLDEVALMKPHTDALKLKLEQIWTSTEAGPGKAYSQGFLNAPPAHADAMNTENGVRCARTF